MESARRKILKTLNSRYLYGRVVSAFRISCHDVHGSYPSEPPAKLFISLQQLFDDP